MCNEKFLLKILVDNSFLLLSDTVRYIRIILSTQFWRFLKPRRLEQDSGPRSDFTGRGIDNSRFFANNTTWHMQISKTKEMTSGIRVLKPHDIAWFR
jgi:hypothetical protein